MILCLFSVRGWGSVEVKNKIKAAFIYKFITYVEFEKTSVNTTLIGVNPASFRPLMEKAAGKSERELIILDLHKAIHKEDSTVPRVLIFDDCSHLKGVLKEHDVKNTFIIAHDTQTCIESSHIELYLEENKYRFSVNKGNLKRDNIKVDSRLLRLAKKVVE